MSYGKPAGIGSGVALATTYDTTPSAPRSSSQIRDYISRIEEMVAEVHGGVSAVEERLDTVTRGASLPPDVPPDAGKPTDESHVGGRLAHIVKNLQHLNTRLQALHARIDV